MSDSSCLCYHCQQPATICYTEVNRKEKVRYYLCSQCPYPGAFDPYETSGSAAHESITLECGNCKTIWNPQEQSHTLGCHLCYTSFKSQLAIFFKEVHGTSVVHIGRAPGESSHMNPSIRLIALNEALQDTLAREDYEQAAIIRDQINHLKQSGSEDASK